MNLPINPVVVLAMHKYREDVQTLEWYKWIDTSCRYKPTKTLRIEKVNDTTGELD